MLDGEEIRDTAPEPEVVAELEVPPAPVAAPEPQAPPDTVPEPEAPPDAALPMIDGEDHAVDPMSVRVDRIVVMLSFLGVAVPSAIGSSIAWAVGGIPTWLYLWLAAGGLVLVGAVTFVGYTWPALHYRHLRYRVDEAGVRIKRGVVWRKIISIPNSRVQHTDVSQGPLERRYNIATLIVHTAGTQGASIQLGGLRHDVALRLRDHLLPTGDHHAV